MMQNTTWSSSSQNQLQKPWFINTFTLKKKKKKLYGEKNVKYDAYHILSLIFILAYYIL